MQLKTLLLPFANSIILFAFAGSYYWASPSSKTCDEAQDGSSMQDGLDPRSSNIARGDAFVSADMVPNAKEGQLFGLWDLSRSEKPSSKSERYYYFHPEPNSKGQYIGLYRYGTKTLNATRSFTWSLKNNEVKFVMNNTKHKYRSEVKVTKSGRIRHAKFVLQNDPFNLGEKSTFKLRPMEASNDLNDVVRTLDLARNIPFRESMLEAHPMLQSSSKLARVWFDFQDKNRQRFRMYQFARNNPSDVNRGWYHEGDFSDWTTETFEYTTHTKRDGSEEFVFKFLDRKQKAKAKFKIESKGEKNSIIIVNDPRNYGLTTRYSDEGPSFMALSNQH